VEGNVITESEDHINPAFFLWQLRKTMKTLWIFSLQPKIWIWLSWIHSRISAYSLSL